MPLAEMRIKSSQVLSIAQQALAAVPAAPAALGLTEADASALMVGAVGRMISADPTIPTVAPRRRCRGIFGVAFAKRYEVGPGEGNLGCLFLL